MLYTGPWCDEIAFYDAGTKVPFERYWQHACSVCGFDVPLPMIANLEVATGAAPSSRAFGVHVKGQVVAALAYCVERSNRLDGQQTALMRVAAFVLPQHRRRGMATALLLRSISIARNNGARYIVLDGLEADEGLRCLAGRLGAALIFKHSACEAWLELAPADLSADPIGMVMRDGASAN